MVEPRRERRTDRMENGCESDMDEQKTNRNREKYLENLMLHSKHFVVIVENVSPRLASPQPPTHTCTQAADMLSYRVADAVTAYSFSYNIDENVDAL